MGLATFPGEQPRKEDVLIAKNYLNAKELKILNNLVSGYFDFAEIQAIKRSPIVYVGLYTSPGHHLMDRRQFRTQARSLTNKPNKKLWAENLGNCHLENPVACRRGIF